MKVGKPWFKYTTHVIKVKDFKKHGPNHRKTRRVRVSLSPAGQEVITMPDKIKQKALLEELLRVKAAIEKAKETDERLELKSNYDTGLDHCDQLIALAQEQELDFPCDEVFFSFRYYITDALPWTGNIMEAVENMLRNLKKLGIINRR